MACSVSHTPAQSRAGQWHHVRSQSRERAEAVKEAALGGIHSGLAVAAAGWRGRMSLLRQVEQDAQAVQLCHGCSRSSPWSPALCCCWLKRKVLRRSLCCSQHPARVPGAVGQQQCPALPCKAALRHCYKYCGNQTSSYGWEQEEKPFFLKVLL